MLSAVSEADTDGVPVFVCVIVLLAVLLGVTVLDAVLLAVWVCVSDPVCVKLAVIVPEGEAPTDNDEVIVRVDVRVTVWDRVFVRVAVSTLAVVVAVGVLWAVGDTVEPALTLAVSLGVCVPVELGVCVPVGVSVAVKVVVVEGVWVPVFVTVGLFVTGDDTLGVT